MNTIRNIKIYILPIIAISLLTAIDQLTKFIVSGSFKLYDSKMVIKGIFSITYIQNEGIAWGMFQGKRVLFIIMTILVLLLCFYVYSNIANKNKFMFLRVSLIVLMSGAMGNMIDRIKLGYVIDFFCFEFIDFPIFNVADIYVVVSMIAIFILIIFIYSNEDFDEIIGIKSKDTIENKINTESNEVDINKNISNTNKAKEKDKIKTL